MCRQNKKSKKNKLRIFLFEKIVLPLNRIRSLFGFRIENKIPRIIIHEKYKNIVKWTTRSFIFVGILSSVISIPVWYISLTLALLLFAFQWFLEKAIFRFTTIFITPMPNFKWDHKQWNAMGYMYTLDLNKPSFFGPAFINKVYGVRVFDMLLAWNYNSHEDVEGNIYISFVEEESNNYRVYLYPSMNRKSIKDFGEEIRKSKENEGKDHHQLVMQMILCQLFPLHSKSNYHKWKELYSAGQPACLGAFTYDETSKETRPIENIVPIRVHEINFRKRKDLNKKDVEYTHGKYTIGL